MNFDNYADDIHNEENKDDLSIESETTDQDTCSTDNMPTEEEVSTTKTVTELTPIIYPDTSLANELQYLSDLNALSTRLPLYRGIYMNRGINILIGSGASDNYVAPHIANLAATSTPVHDRHVETAGGQSTKIEEKVNMVLHLNGIKQCVTAYVFPTKFDLILGRSWLQEALPKPDWNTDSWYLKDGAKTVKLSPWNKKNQSSVNTAQLNLFVISKRK